MLKKIGLKNGKNNNFINQIRDIWLNKLLCQGYYLYGVKGNILEKMNY